MDHPRLADATRATRRMFVRDLVLEARIGVYAHEQGRTQRIRVNLDMAVEDGGAANISRSAVGADELGRVVDYDTMISAVRDVVATGHVQLVETLAERVAEACLKDARVRVARVMVEKLDVFADAASVGVEIERRNT
ncbi:MAG: dihydroneopterin aldolase [Rhodospirillales bacterium]|nr:dihydroneopterin aldolase [Rhodospirillales bacterium]